MTSTTPTNGPSTDSSDRPGRPADGGSARTSTSPDLTSETMQQWRLPADATTPGSLVVEEVEKPTPGPGEVRVRVRAISINSRDRMILTTPFGRIPGRDLVPLSDVAGEIDALGPEVTGWQVGDRVTDIHNGSWIDEIVPTGGSIGPGSLDERGVLAQWVILPTRRVAAAPRNFDFSEASTLPVAGVTAWHALFEDHPVTAGQAVLVIGTGGVALFALQMAKAVGARVYLAVRQESKGQQAVALGADGFVNTGDADWGKRVAGLAGDGVNKVVDTVGPGLLAQELDALAISGEIAMLGLFQTEAAPLDYFAMMGKLASLRAVAVGSGRMQRDLVAFVEDHDIHPVIGTRFGFAQAPDAYEALSGPDVFGKITIDVA